MDRYASNNNNNNKSIDALNKFLEVQSDALNKFLEVKSDAWIGIICLGEKNMCLFSIKRKTIDWKWFNQIMMKREECGKCSH